MAHAAGRKVALSLSDAFCVDRYRDEFLGLIRDGTIDIVFANEAELNSLYKEDDLDRAVAGMQAEKVLAVVTRSEKGCVILAGGTATAVPAAPVSAVVDTTGAGDLFAAGFLAGFVRDWDHVASAKLGALAAAEIIQHIGARPKSDLKALASANDLVV